MERHCSCTSVCVEALEHIVEEWLAGLWDLERGEESYNMLTSECDMAMAVMNMQQLWPLAQDQQQQKQTWLGEAVVGKKRGSAGVGGL